MSKPKTIQDLVMASIQAEDAGVSVDWKQTCLKVVQAAQSEIARLTAEDECGEIERDFVENEVNTETEDKE